MRLLFGLLLLIISLTVPPLSSQGFQRTESPPPLVRITGTFLNAEAANKHASIMELRVNEHCYTLHVREVRSPPIQPKTGLSYETWWVSHRERASGNAESLTEQAHAHRATGARRPILRRRTGAHVD